MPGVVFVLGCDLECWLVELNQTAHKLNFQHAFFESSFKLMVGMLLINCHSVPINFAAQKSLNEVNRARIQKTMAKLRRHCNVNRARALQAARIAKSRSGLELKPSDFRLQKHYSGLCKPDFRKAISL